MVLDRVLQKVDEREGPGALASKGDGKRRGEVCRWLGGRHRLMRRRWPWRFRRWRSGQRQTGWRAGGCEEGGEGGRAGIWWRGARQRKIRIVAGIAHLLHQRPELIDRHRRRIRRRHKRRRLRVHLVDVSWALWASTRQVGREGGHCTTHRKERAWLGWEKGQDNTASTSSILRRAVPGVR